MADLLKSKQDNLIVNNAAVKFTNDPVIISASTPKVVDTFNVFENSVANYTVLAKGDAGAKETFNVTILADKTSVSWTVYGRVNINLPSPGDVLVDVFATVSGGNVKVQFYNATGVKNTITVTRTYLETF